MECDFCRNEFELIVKGSGGSNRKFCYDCFPQGLDRRERHLLRSKLLTQMAHRHKIEKGCSICGYNKFGGALEWHHADGDKEHDPASALNRSWERYIIESDKCVLLCANCHREVHSDIIGV